MSVWARASQRAPRELWKHSGKAEHGMTELGAQKASNLVVDMDISGRSFGGIRILLKEFGSLGIFCDVAVHMNGAL